MSTTGDIEIDFDRELESRLRQFQQNRLDAFDHTALAWLALLPAWTWDLAQKCEFPTGTKPRDKFLTEARSIGLCDFGSAHPLTREGGGEFWMPETMREEVISGLRQRHGAKFLHEQTLVIAGRIRADAGETKTSAVLQQWAAIADLSKYGLGAAADHVTECIDSLLKSGKTGDALAVVRTASYLADALGGQLESAVLLATHRVELAYRAAQDARHLRNFLPRQEQKDAFLDLVNGPDDIWALHFIGMGGVGKTMLIRYITSESALSRGRFTTRVDFDHMSPNYPVRRPEQLLVELAEELRMHSEPAIFESFQDSVGELQVALSAQSSGYQAVSAMDHPLFDKVFRAFVSWISQLPGQVVLILDTCEELAKVQPIGEAPSGITATFKILERMHKEVKSLRVVFAGRRLLALSGHEWKVAAADLPESKKSLPAEKKFLRLHEIRGFTLQEAEHFFEVKELHATKEMRDAILFRSRETGIAADLEAYPGDRRDVERYNPFDVALYTNWLREEPSLTAEKVAQGEIDPYVESRILTGLKPGVRNLLPAVVLLRRFDKLMLRTAVPQLGEAAFDEIYRELGEQEWTDYQPDEALRSTFLEIDKKLYPRLWKYSCDPARRYLLEDYRKCIGRGLLRLIEQRSPEELGFDYIRAALELLPVEDGMRLWENLDARIAENGYWSWAGAVSARLLGEAEETGEIGSELTPAIWATHAGALLHEKSTADVRTIWSRVVRTAELCPDIDLKVSLLNRARLGQIAGKAQAGQQPSKEELADLNLSWNEIWRVADGQPKEQIAASVCAAVEAVVELAEAQECPDSQQLGFTEFITKGEFSNELLAFAYTLRSRVFALSGARTQALQSFVDAEQIARSASEQTAQRWADWRAPSSLRDRVRLETLRVDEMVPDDVLRIWRVEAESRLSSVDADRLLSRILRLRLNNQLIPGDELSRLKAAEIYDPTRQPVCAAHRETPPLFATICDGWTAIGKAETALADLETRANLATQSGQDFVSVRAAERAKLEVIRRMRLFKRAQALAESLARTTDPEMAAIGWPALAVNGLVSPDKPSTPDEKTSSEMIDAWWRSQSSPDHDAAKRAVEIFCKLYPRIRGRRAPTEAEVAEPSCETGSIASELLPRGSRGFSPTAFLEYSLELDWQEALLLASRFSLTPVQQSSAGETLPLSITLMPCHRPKTDREVGLILRFSALLHAGDGRRPFSELGMRRVAEVTFAEGELLAMRLPKLAAELLDEAHKLFMDADDSVGATISAIRSIILMIQNDHAEPIQARLAIQEKLRPAYEKLYESKVITKLPSWSELVNMTNASDAAALRKLDHPSWGGWLHRLFCCLAWTAERKSPDQVVYQMTWLSGHYRGKWPPEMRLPGDAYLRVRPVQRKRRDWLESAIKWLAGTTLTALSFVASLVIASVVVLAVRGWASEYASRVILFWSLEVLVTIVSLSWVVYTPLAIAKIIRSFLTARTKAEVSITAESASIDKGIEVAIPVTISLSRGDLELPPFWKASGSSRRRRGECQTPGLRSYSAAREEMPPEVMEEVARLQARLTGRGWLNQLAVGIRTTPSIARFAWEALVTPSVKAAPRRTLLGRAVRTLKEKVVSLMVFVLVTAFAFGGLAEVEEFLLNSHHLRNLLLALCCGLVVIMIVLSWRKPGKELHFYRTDDPRPESSDIIDRWRTGEVYAVCSRTWAILAESGWQPLRGRVSVNLNISNLSEEGAVLSPKLLHLIGLPMLTTAGLRLKVLSSQTEKIGASSKSAKRAGQLLFGPEDFPVDSLPLVVLQGEPVAITSQSKTRREQAAALRAFAAQLFAAGARAVVVLPSLPPSLAERALVHLAKGLKGNAPPDLRRILTAVAATRTLIANWNRPIRRLKRWVRALFCWMKSTLASLPKVKSGKTPAASKEPSQPGQPEIFDAEHQLEMACDVCVFLRPEP